MVYAGGCKLDEFEGTCNTREEVSGREMSHGAEISGGEPDICIVSRGWRLRVLEGIPSLISLERLSAGASEPGLARETRIYVIFKLGNRRLSSAISFSGSGKVQRMRRCSSFGIVSPPMIPIVETIADKRAAGLGMR